MTTLPCDVFQEYEIPTGVTAVRIEVGSGGSGGRSSSAVTLRIRPGATLRLRFVCLAESESPTAPSPHFPCPG